MANNEATKPTSAFDLVPKSFELVKNNLPMFLLVSSAPLLMTVISAVNGKPFSGTSANIGFGTILQNAFGLSLGVMTVLIVVSIVLQTMALGLQLSVSKGGKPNVAELWEVARTYTFRYIGLGIITGLMVVGGLILLIVPGIIVMTRVFLAPYVMVDQKMGIIDSLRRSSELSKGYGLSIWGVIGVSLLLAILAQIVFGLFSETVAAVAGALVGIGYSVAPALRYFELKKLNK